MQTGETPVGVVLWINLDGNAVRAQLRHHGLEAAHPEIDHPLLLAGAKVAGRLLERCEHGGTGLLLPDRVVVVRGNHRDPEVLAVPRGEAFRVTRAAEQAANPQHGFHLAMLGPAGVLLLARIDPELQAVLWRWQRAGREVIERARR